MNAPRPLRLVAALTVAVLLAGCAAQKVHDEGLREIEAGRREAGIDALRRASEMDPDNLRYRLSYMAQRQALIETRLGRAEVAAAAGRDTDAAAEWTAVLALEPGNERAAAGLVRLEESRARAGRVQQAARAVEAGDLREADRLLEPLRVEAPRDREVQQLTARVAALRAESAAAPAAPSPLRRTVSLQLRDANLRMVFEALSRGNGLNIVVDRDVRAELKASIHVTDAPLEDAIDLILMQHQLARRMLNGNTLLVYPSNPAKLREYQELHVRSFQLSNADVKHVATVLRTLLKLRDVVVDEKTNSLVLREPAETLAVAEKIIAAQEFPEAEVMLELEVLEVSRNRLTELGVKWPQGVSLTTPSSASTLGALRALGSDDLLVSALSASVNLRLEDNDTNTLASPRIRVRSREKARVMIGDRVPIITNTLTPVTTGGSVVTGSVQYLDVGLKLDIEPQVHAESDVGIKLSLEVSNIAKEIPGPNGSLAYQIGTRSAQTSLRLRDGETQVLAGLLNDSERSSGAKVPGLGQLPVLGKLFGSERRDAGKTEIVLSITPRIVRPFAASSAANRDIRTGTEATVRSTPLTLEPVGRVRIETAPETATGGRMAPSLGVMPSAPTRRPPPRLPAATEGGEQ